MIVEYVSIVKIIKDEWGEYEYIYNAFNYNNTNCSIFFTYYKYLFNMNLDYLKIRITPTLIERIVNIEIICDKQEY